MCCAASLDSLKGQWTQNWDFLLFNSDTHAVEAFCDVGVTASSEFSISLFWEHGNCSFVFSFIKFLIEIGLQLKCCDQI